MPYITTDNEGRITASADWFFPGSTSCPCDVVRYPNGRMYRTDELPPVYGLPGSSEQQFGGDCPAGWGVMAGPRPDAVEDPDGTVTALWQAGEDGEWQPVPTVTLASVRAAKLAEINAAADAAIAAMTATYPAGEVATFDKQEAEARAYLADATAPTPLLSALSTARGLDRAELVRRVIVKADAFAVASGTIIGQRQALEDVLDLCTCMEEVRRIAVPAVFSGVGMETAGGV